MECQKAIDNERLLEMCMSLIDQGFNEQARNILEPMCCAMACYLKARIYLIESINFLKSVNYTSHLDTEGKRRLINYVVLADKYFVMTHSKLNQLNPKFLIYLRWHLESDGFILSIIGKQCKKLVTISKMTERSDSQTSINELIEHIDKWNLNQNTR